MKTSKESIIRNFFTPHDMQDVSAFYEQFAENIVIYVPKHFPWGGCYYGLRGAGDLLSNVSQHVLADIEVEEIFSSGEQVVSIGRLHGKALATGERIDARVVHVFTFNGEGKIRRVEFYGEGVEQVDFKVKYSVVTHFD
ncbi:MAG: nuclear transport factor 2 family protein [Lewinellaceae bacterium]|nr:nuclear transport factor 2 family protein [Saprospiraceae bacterium]MCB9337953.1 nuclear transport factor 2 family protein [Lewinellaceae bacterium]